MVNWDVFFQSLWQSFTQFHDLLWLVLATIGGLLLIDESKLRTRDRIGIILIFVAFLAQVYWEITQPWTTDSLGLVIFVSIFTPVSFIVAWFRGWQHKKSQKKKQ
jgi:threonine/homoserine efflux transporter RhtA